MKIDVQHCDGMFPTKTVYMYNIDEGMKPDSPKLDMKVALTMDVEYEEDVDGITGGVKVDTGFTFSQSEGSEMRIYFADAVTGMVIAIVAFDLLSLPKNVIEDAMQGLKIEELMEDDSDDEEEGRFGHFNRTTCEYAATHTFRELLTEHFGQERMKQIADASSHISLH